MTPRPLDDFPYPITDAGKAQAEADAYPRLCPEDRGLVDALRATGLPFLLPSAELMGWLEPFYGQPVESVRGHFRWIVAHNPPTPANPKP